MPRLTFRSLRPLLVVSLLVALAACAGTPPEEQLLTTFFRAARVRDNATLANLATIEFNPRTQGSVQEFEVTSITPEQRRTLDIQTLMAEEDKAKAEDDELTAQKRVYQDANIKDLERISQAQRDGTPITGADAEMVEVWNKWGADQLESRRKLSQARARTRAESSIAIGSLTAPGRDDVDVTGMDVELVSKQVTVNAQVRPLEGEATPKTLVFTLQRAIGTKDGETREGRWLITGLDVQGAAADAG